MHEMACWRGLISPGFEVQLSAGFQHHFAFFIIFNDRHGNLARPPRYHVKVDSLASWLSLPAPLTPGSASGGGYHDHEYEDEMDEMERLNNT